MSLNLPEQLPETAEHQQFLLNLPDDLKDICVKVQDIIKEEVINGRCTIVQILVAIRTTLNLPQSLGTTIVIANATREAISQCGIISPEIIFENLAKRKRNLIANNS